MVTVTHSEALFAFFRFGTLVERRDEGRFVAKASGNCQDAVDTLEIGEIRLKSIKTDSKSVELQEFRLTSNKTKPGDYKKNTKNLT